jgi:cell shape-determining protein MreC
MKTTSAILSIICSLAAAGLAIGLVVEHQAGSKLAQGNKAMRQQLSQMDELTAENRRLSSLVTNANGLPSRPNEVVKTPAAGDEPAKELLRLRAEVNGLRQQSQEIETLREDTRRARAALESSRNTP